MTSESARERLDSAVQTLRGGRAGEAIAQFCRILEAEPRNAEALLYLAQAMAAAEDFSGALETAEKAYSILPRPEMALVGGGAAVRLADTQQTIVWSARARGIKATHLPAVLKLAVRHAEAGFYRAAAGYYAAALDGAPDDFDTLKSFCFYAAMYDRREAIAVLEDFIARNAQTLRLVSLARWLLLPLKEHELRRENGLGPYSATADLHFRFAANDLAAWHRSVEAWLAEEPDNLEAVTMMVLVLVARGDVMQAEPHLVRLRAKLTKNPMTVAHFGPDFFATVDDAEGDIEGGLAEVEALVPGVPAGPCVFVGCDALYFDRFGWTLARSFTAAPHDVFLQLHIFDLPADQRTAFLSRLASIMGRRPYGVSMEATGLAGTEAAAIHYHAVRFIRAARFAEGMEFPLCLIDADMVFTGAADRLFAGLGEDDAQLLLSPGRVEISNQITACVALINAGPAGRAYLRRVAAYLATSYRRDEMVWGIDQVAFYAVYADMERRGALPRIGPVPFAVHDGRYAPETLLWASKCGPQDPHFAELQAMLARFS